VVHKSEEMKNPDKKEDRTGDNQVQFLAHLFTPQMTLSPAAVT
jgi:hypothetical protein